ncbi:hypothetical protein D3C74_50200 [compost metagenome]
MLQVRVTRFGWLNPNFWYYRKRGELFEVIKEEESGFYVATPDGRDRGNFIFREDIECKFSILVEGEPEC